MAFTSVNSNYGPIFTLIYSESLPKKLLVNLLRFHVLRVRSLVRSENCLRNRFIPSSTVKRGQNAQKPRKVGQMALAPKDQNNRSIPHRVINFSSKMKWRNQGPSISRRKPPKKSHNDPMPTLGYFRHNTGTFAITVVFPNKGNF